MSVINNSQVLQHLDVLELEDIEYILNLPEVIAAKSKIESRNNGSIYFDISLTDKIKMKLSEKFGINFDNINSIPMRWIKGDTLPHVDRGINSFDNTYLLYLTDSEGELIVDSNSYPIKQGSAYIFKEGLNHKTINTGIEPRLLLGPMSDAGFAVGTGISRPGGTTIYIRQNTNIEYSIDNQTTWNTLSSFPVTFINSNTSAGLLKIEFTMNILLNDIDGGINKYFTCGSNSIQFGSTSVLADGFRPKIRIDGVTNYPGLIKNGDSSFSGYDNIHIYNLEVLSINSTSLLSNSGWVAQNYFGKGSVDNYIINCSSDGDIPTYGGGIVGEYAGIGSGSSLTIIGCSSSGAIEQYAGGIVGSNAGSSGGSCICISSWSTGAQTSTHAGGITGSSAGSGSSGSITINSCYSTGIIGSQGGGICGANCGYSSGSGIIINSYSNGSIAAAAGGIVGSSQNTIITNCYTTGNISGGGGIFGNGSVTISNCYTTGTVTGGDGYIEYDSTLVPATCYSEAKTGTPGSWNKTNANTVLTGLPNPIIGNTWVETTINQPYELFNMGFTPYPTINLRTTPSPSLKNSFSSTIAVGGNTSGGLVGNIYSKDNVTSGGYEVGGSVTKDMSNEDYRDEFDPSDYPDFFPDMAPFIPSNIEIGDKTEINKFNASYWNDLGNDVFDEWGYFYLYDVSSGKYYFPLISPRNQSNSIFSIQTFNAFGRTFTIKHGWCVQGVFKFEIFVNDNLPFKFGTYGNMGSDGDEVINEYIEPYSIKDTSLNLYYICHAEEGDSTEILYSYWIPKKPTQNAAKTYDYYNVEDDDSMMSKEVTDGLIVYFAKKNDVKDWVINDLNLASYEILDIVGGSPSSYDTISIDQFSGIISTTLLTEIDTYTLYIRNSGSYNISTYDLNVINNIPCLTEDTTVLTPSGYKNISYLRPNDSIITSDNRIVKIVNVFSTTVKASFDTYPYIIKKNSLADNYPPNDSKVSGEHLIKFNDEWIHPILSRKFRQDKSKKVIKYYHIETPNYATDDLVINGGLIVEPYTGINKLNYLVRTNRMSKYFLELKKVKNSKVIKL